MTGVVDVPVELQYMETWTVQVVRDVGSIFNGS